MIITSNVSHNSWKKQLLLLLKQTKKNKEIALLKALTFPLNCVSISVHLTSFRIDFLLGQKAPKSGIFQLDFTHFLFSCFSFEDFCGFCYVWDFPVVCAHNAKASRVTICKRFIYKERRKMHQTRSHFIQLSAVAVKRRNTNRKRYMWQWHIYSFFTSFSQRFCRVGMMLSHWKKKCLLTAALTSRAWKGRFL